MHIPSLEISSRCIGCDSCRIICPEESVFKLENSYFIETWSCTLCNLCIQVCPVDCIKLVEIED